MNTEQHSIKPHKLTYVALAIACVALVLSIIGVMKKGATASTASTTSQSGSASLQGPTMTPQTVPAPSGGAGGNSSFGPGASMQ